MQNNNIFDNLNIVGFDWGDVISSIEDIIETARAGKMFILIDHEERENEGDLVIAGEYANADIINFMAKYGRGLICLAMTGERIDALGLPLMAASNSSRHETAFTVSIEAREGVSTGISAPDRAHTIATAINPNNNKSDIATPGHVFPLRAREGGVLVRAGHTEAAIDIARLANLNPSGVICEIMNEDGTMARRPDLIAFAQKHALKIGTISDLIAYRRRHDNLVSLETEEYITIDDDTQWLLKIYRDETQEAEHIILIKGDISDGAPTLVRMHALDPLRDIVGIDGIKRSHEFRNAMKIIAKEGRGVLVLLRDITLKMPKSSEKSSQKIRQYGLGAQILSALGLSDLILLTNSPPPDVVALNAYGLDIVGTRKITA